MRRLGILALLFVAFGGYVKGLPALDQLGRPMTITAVVLVIAAVVAALVRARTVPREVLAVAALAWVFLPGASGFDATAYTDEKLTVELPLMLLCLVGAILLLRTERDRAWWLGAVVAFGALVAVLALLFPSTTGYVGTVSLEGSSTISQGRAVGAAMVVLALYAVASHGRPRLWAVVGTLALGAATLQAGSRGPVIAALIAVLVVVAASPQRGRGVRVVLAGAAVALAAYLAFSADLVAGRLLVFNDTSAAERRRLWSDSLDVLTAHPGGIGWGNLYYSLPAGSVPDVRVYPHNVLLEVGTEAGWLALAGLVALLGVAWVRQRRAASTGVEAAMLGLLVFFLVNALVSGDVGDNRGLWVAVGAALVASRLEDGRSPRCGRRVDGRAGGVVEPDRHRVGGRDVAAPEQPGGDGGRRAERHRVS